MPSPNVSTKCPLCGGGAVAVSSAYPGYKLPATFAIAECHYCDMQFAEPRQVEPHLYEDIYCQAQTLPGYSRYARLADGISAARKPLDWLAESEEMYWFVREALRSLGLAPTRNIVEVGSGLGYLTFALNRAGYSAQGFDLSVNAVEDARRRFGDYYSVADVTCLDSSFDGRADVVVLTEVIEHVPDPDELLRAVVRLLRPGGHALLTTPNKSSYPHGSCWQTENPPVHLWWFSEGTLRRLALKHGLGIEFFDFSGYVFPRWIPTARGAFLSRTPSFLDANGRQIYFPAGLRGVAARVGAIAPRAMIRYHRALGTLIRGNRVAMQRSATLGVTLRKLARVAE